jgi:hypothetical protein
MPFYSGLHHSVKSQGYPLQRDIKRYRKRKSDAHPEDNTSDSKWYVQFDFPGVMQLKGETFLCEL